MGSQTAEASSQSPSGAAPGATPAELSPRDLFLKAYRCIVLSRRLEEKLTSLYRAGKIVGGVYVGRGQESFSASLTVHLDSSLGDVYGPLIRDQAGRLAFGEPFLDAPRTYFGSAAGPMRGRDGNVHRGRPDEGIPAMISHLGSLISVIGGILLAKRFKGKTGFVGAASIGDGGTSTGAAHEAMNLAGVERLPMVVAVANNRY
ncbi:MAG: thiamine pyrophosphate-dependent enzyme, partial [Verrucomicrobiales bacterium]